MCKNRINEISQCDLSHSEPQEEKSYNQSTNAEKTFEKTSTHS